MRFMHGIRTLSLLLCLIATSAISIATLGAQQAEVKRDVVYVPTPQPVVDAMLKAVRVTGSDVVYDLGSGDGRIAVTAAKVYGARADRHRHRSTAHQGSQRQRQSAGVTDKVTFLNQDLFTCRTSAKPLS